MDGRRFDRFTRGLAHHLPRRGLLGTIGAAGLAAVAGRAGLPTRAKAQEIEQTISVPCTRCNCDEGGQNCECCLIGITGGGIVRTEAGDATLVLFATELGDAAERQATGFVRWVDPISNGGTILESVGPITYEWQGKAPGEREIRGTMAVNGEGQEPFVLLLIDAGPDFTGGDAATLEVGDLTAAGSEGVFSYTASGQVVGGDIQLLDNIAPVAGSSG